MPFVPVPNITHVDSVGTVDNPVTVDGGTLDLVQQVVQAVTAAGGTIDTVGEVQTVVNAVTAAGGTIDTVAEVQAVVGAVTAAGGTIDSVQTVIDAVTAAGGHIDTVASAGIDPAASIATVSSNVPMLGRDYFYWPAMQGEQMAPSLSAGMAYGEKDDLPCYIGTNSATATFPQLPRRNPVSGKTAVTLSFQFRVSSLSGISGGFITLFQWGSLLQIGVLNTGKWTFLTGSASFQTTPGSSPSVNVWHTVAITISSTGTISVNVDGATLLNITTNLATRGWPPTVFSTFDVRPTFYALNSTYQTFFSQFQAFWS